MEEEALRCYYDAKVEGSNCYLARRAFSQETVEAESRENA